MLDPAVFKAYDVRGLYGSELDEAGAYAIGRAYVDVFSPRRIAVGRDMRVHAPAMAAAVIAGAVDSGTEVVDKSTAGMSNQEATTTALEMGDYVFVVQGSTTAAETFHFEAQFAAR